MPNPFSLDGWRTLQPEQWSYDPYAKQCECCDAIVGRYGVMQDEHGLRHIMWWPHLVWDGQPAPFRCREHTSRSLPSVVAAPIPVIVLHVCGHREVHSSDDARTDDVALDYWRAAGLRLCTRCEVQADAER